MAGEYSGKDLVIQYGGTVLSSDFRSFASNETAEEIDVTAGADPRKAYIAGPVDGDFSASFLDLTTGTANYLMLTPGASGTLAWSPEGTAAGKPRNSCLAIVTNRKRDIPYDGAVAYDITWRQGGNITAGTN